MKITQITECVAFEMYDEMLNECMTEWETPAGTPAENMKNQDPIMYNCGFSDFIDSLNAENYEIEGWDS